MARHRRLGLFLSTQSDHVSRLISKELFQGEIGAFLQSVGLSPDTPCNIAQTAETFATMDARYRENLAGFVDRINRHVNGLRIKPLFLMPETVWGRRIPQLSVCHMPVLSGGPRECILSCRHAASCGSIRIAAASQCVRSRGTQVCCPSRRHVGEYV